MILEGLTNSTDPEVVIAGNAIDRKGLIDLLSLGIETQKKFRSHVSQQIGELEAAINKLDVK